MDSVTENIATTYRLERSSSGYPPLDEWHVTLHSVQYDHDEELRTLLGTATVYAMNDHAPQVRGRGLLDAADEISQSLLEVVEFTEDPANDIERQFELWIGTWLYIDAVELVESARGQGLGLRLVADLVAVLSNHATPVLLKAAPLQPCETSEEFQLGAKRLANHWATLGFKELGEGYMGLDTAYNTPEIDARIVV